MKEANTAKALVLFSERLPRKPRTWWKKFSIVVAPLALHEALRKKGIPYTSLEAWKEAGSIQEATRLLEELSILKLPDGRRIAKLFLYKGYELWWVRYNSLFHQFCLPYTYYRRLLEHLASFDEVLLHDPPFKQLFACFLESRNSICHTVSDASRTSPSMFPFGVFTQWLLTCVSLPFVFLLQRRVLVFTGDKFEKDRDYDFRMRYIYEALRQRNIPFLECIRSLETWKAVLAHFSVRSRPVIYSEAVAFTGSSISIFTGGRRRARRHFGPHLWSGVHDPELRFKYSLAVQYLHTVYDEVWSVRVMSLLLRWSGVRVAFIAASLERNFHAVLGCKINAIPIIGILHGVASREYNVYDFLTHFEGEKSLSVDRYGLWSEWWRSYYLQYSKAYRANQLFVSGPMRPLERGVVQMVRPPRASAAALKVLFIGEQLAHFPETVPFLDALLNTEGIEVYLKFRFYRDGYEDWLTLNHPHLLNKAKVVHGNMQEAIAQCDVVVGSHSTAVLEALFQLKPIVLYDTNKWGDYFTLAHYDAQGTFFALNPTELLERIRNSDLVSVEDLCRLRERFFGDPTQNGSAWVVDQIENALTRMS